MLQHDRRAWHCCQEGVAVVLCTYLTILAVFCPFPLLFAQFLQHKTEEDNDEGEAPTTKKSRRAVATLQSVTCSCCAEEYPLTISVRRHTSKLKNGLKFLCDTCVDVCGICRKVRLFCLAPYCSALLLRPTPLWPCT
jgi:hypothetical protein